MKSNKKLIMTVALALAILLCASSCSLINGFANEEGNNTTIQNSTTSTEDNLGDNTHLHEYKAIKTYPSCLDKGYTTYTCNCGDSYVDDYVDALGHWWGVWNIVSMPTDTEAGVKERVCECGEKELGTFSLVESYSEGLEFELGDDGQSYKVVGIGTFNGENLIIPNVYNGKFVTAIGDDAFRECGMIRTVIIPDSVTHIGNWAFVNCYSIKNITFPESIIYAGQQAFAYCVSIEEVKLPNSLTKLSSGLFDSCFMLKRVDFGNNISYVSNNLFNACNNLIYNEYADGLYVGDESNPYLIFIKPKYDNIETFEFHSDTKFICDDAFENITTLKNVTLPESLVGIGNSAFWGCESLESIVIPNSVKYIDDAAFSFCYNLKNVTMSKNIEIIDRYVFDPSFESFEIEYNEYNGGLYLGNDENPYLVLVYVEPFDESTSFTVHNDTKVIAGSAFDYCEWLESVILSDSVQYIGDYAFSGCSSLTEIIIPDSVLKMGREIFTWCEEITIYCEAKSLPRGWDNDWNFVYNYVGYDEVYYYLPVVWGYTTE